MLRVLYDELSKVSVGEELSLSGDEGHHLVGVRRCRLGESVGILDGKGTWAQASAIEIGRREARLRIEEMKSFEPLMPRIHLCLGMPKQKVFELILQKSVELGIWKISPMFTKNSEVSDKKLEQKFQRWQQILRDAVKQSGNPYLPGLDTPRKFSEVTASQTAKEFSVCGALVSGSVPFGQFLNKPLPSSESIRVYVGPEGDFHAEEYAELKTAGAHFIDLGPLVLRVETAASLIVGSLHLRRLSSGG